MGVPLGRQQLHHLLGGQMVVSGEGGEVGKAQLLGRIGQQHAGHGNRGEARLKQLQVAPQEQNPHGPALPAQLAGVGHLVGVLVQVVDSGILAGVSEQGLHLLHQIGKKHIHNPFDNDGDAGAGLLL